MARFLLYCLLFSNVLMHEHAFAQSSTSDQPSVQEAAENQGEPIAEEPAMIDRPVVKLRSLDKITARTGTFQAEVGSTVKFGSLYIKPRVCKQASPLESPESAAFLQIWEVNAEDESEWVFSGWMFASSPGLSSMDHPIYDVWVLSCLEQKSDVSGDNENDQVKPGEGEVRADEVPARPDEE